MEISSATNSATSNSANATPQRNITDSLGGLKLDDFFDLMIKELQNQDPLNPQDSDKILQQFSQLRQIGATDKLNETLDSVLLGQQLSNASALIDKSIVGLSDDGTNIEGVVDRVTLEDGLAKLHIGDQTVSITNIREIHPPEPTTG